MSKNVLFLFANRPFPLQVRMMQLLEKDGYVTAMLCMTRRGSSHNIPLTGSLRKAQVTVIEAPIGQHPFVKVINKLNHIRLFARGIRQRAPQIVHAWNFEMLLAAVLAKRRLPELAIVYTLQDTTPWMVRPATFAFQRWAHRHVDAWFVTSRGFETGLLRPYRLVDEEVAVSYVPNSPPAHLFADFAPRLPQEEMVIGCIGTLRGEEGLRTLVEAVARARHAGENIRVLFAGSGISQSLVEQFAREHAFVEYFGPYQYERDILNIYARIDVFYAVYDRSHDKRIHLAYRLCEAVCCGLPIIVAEGTHMAKVAEGHGVGGAVPIGDVGLLKKQLITWSRDPAQRRAIMQNASSAQPSFTFNSYAETIKDAYAAIPTRAAPTKPPAGASAN